MVIYITVLRKKHETKKRFIEKWIEEEEKDQKKKKATN